MGSISLTVEAERANHMKQAEKDLVTEVEPKKLVFEELIRSRAEQYEERIKTMTTILKEDDPIEAGSGTIIPAGATGGGSVAEGSGSAKGGSLVGGNVVAGSIEESSLSKIEDASLVEGGSSIAKLENELDDEGAEAEQEIDQTSGPGDAPSLVAGSLRGSLRGSKQGSVRGSLKSQPGKAASSPKGSTHSSSASDEQELPGNTPCLNTPCFNTLHDSRSIVSHLPLSLLAHFMIAEVSYHTLP